MTGTLSAARSTSYFRIEDLNGIQVVRLCSEDGMNRLTRRLVEALAERLHRLANDSRPVILTGNRQFFSVGADLQEIAGLDGPDAFEFAKMGQALMTAIEDFPAPVYAAISGYCMGGGLDLALACHRRIAPPHAIFGHRGAALGLVTGWGGTQRLPRLIGKSRALQLFVAAEKIHAEEALRIGLIDAIADVPETAAVESLHHGDTESKREP